MRATAPQPQAQPRRSLAALWTIWSALAAGLSIPLGLSRLPLPHPATPNLAPETLASLAYALGIALTAAALLLRKRWRGRYFGAVLISSMLVESVAWVGFLAWLIDARTPAFYTLLAVAALGFWLVRPRREEWQSLAQDAPAPTDLTPGYRP